MDRPKISELTKREREIMEVVYDLDCATAAQVVDNLPGKPVNATIRTMLGVLEEKGFLRHEREKGRYIYYPTIPLSQARKYALHNVVDTFFKDAEASAVISILKKSDSRLSGSDADMIMELIRKTREEGR